jgi:hypothetical protein
LRQTRRDARGRALRAMTWRHPIVQPGKFVLQLGSHLGIG